MVQNRKKLRKDSHLIIHFPTSKQAVWNKQTSEWCEQTDKQTAQYLHLDFSLFWPVVQLKATNDDKPKEVVKNGSDNVEVGVFFIFRGKLCPLH